LVGGCFLGFKNNHLRKVKNRAGGKPTKKDAGAKGMLSSAPPPADDEPKGSMKQRLRLAKWKKKIAPGGGETGVASTQV